MATGALWPKTNNLLLYTPLSMKKQKIIKEHEYKPTSPAARSSKIATYTSLPEDKKLWQNKGSDANAKKDAIIFAEMAKLGTGDESYQAVKIGDDYCVIANKGKKLKAPGRIKCLSPESIKKENRAYAKEIIDAHNHGEICSYGDDLFRVDQEHKLLIPLKIHMPGYARFHQQLEETFASLGWKITAISDSKGYWVSEEFVNEQKRNEEKGDDVEARIKISQEAISDLDAIFNAYDERFECGYEGVPESVMLSEMIFDLIENYDLQIMILPILGTLLSMVDSKSRLKKATITLKQILIARLNDHLSEIDAPL